MAKEREYLEAYDQNGQFKKVAERTRLLREIKAYSLLHGDAKYAVRVCHLFLMNSAGELYIIQRAKKDENPYLFDKTLGAHMVKGETFDVGLQRESGEELGIKAKIVMNGTYQWAVRHTDLEEEAVITEFAYDPWYKSVRKNRDGTEWVKRHHVKNYVGIYNGELTTKNFIDGEALQLKLITLNDLEAEIKATPEVFTHDLIDLVSRYKPHLLPFRT